MADATGGEGAMRLRPDAGMPAPAQAAPPAVTERDWLLNVLNSMPDGVYIVDRQYDIQYVNPALKGQFGEVNGRKCYEYLQDRREVCPWCKNSAVFDQGQTIRWEWYSAKTGRTYDLLDTPLREPDGRVFKLEVLRDITERKRLEEALRRSEEDLKHAQAVSHTGSWRLDVQRNRLMWSDEAYRIFGIPGGMPLTYEAFLSCVHPEDREYVDRRWNAALCDEPYEIEHRIMAGDRVKWVRQKAVLEFDSEGLLQGGFGTVQDITEHKQAEEAMRIKDTAFASAINSFLITDLEGRITYANPSFIRKWGAASEEELLGRSILDFSASRDRAREILKAVMTSGAWVGEEVGVLKDGSLIDIELSASLVTNEAGKPICLLCSLLDITERKKVDRLKDQFIGLVSHELRTPLTVIKGCLSTPTGRFRTYKVIAQALPSWHLLLTRPWPAQPFRPEPASNTRHGSPQF